MRSYRKYARKNKTNLLDKKVSSCFTSEDKAVLYLIKKDKETSYAQLIRDAVHEKYAEYFTER